jgi:hypothetical protein
MACDDLKPWVNNSRAHFGVPNIRFVKPVVRVNAQLGDIPDGYIIPRCFVEAPALYQSGLSVATSAVVTAVFPTELVIPANEIKGGERFSAKLSISAPTTVSSTDTVTLVFRVVDGADATVSTANVVTMAVPVSGGPNFASMELEMYYDVTDSQLHIMAKTRSNTTYATTTLADMNINVDQLQKLRIGITQSDVSHSEVITFLYGSIGRLN